MSGRAEADKSVASQIRERLFQKLPERDYNSMYPLFRSFGPDPFRNPFGISGSGVVDDEKVLVAGHLGMSV